MSNQDQVVNLLGDIRDALRKMNTNGPPAEPRGVIGGDTIAMLAFLDGWNYQVQKIPGPKILPRGQLVEVFPQVTNEEGWNIGGLGIVSDPDVHILGQFDALQVSFSLRQINAFNPFSEGAEWIRCNIYDPTVPAFGFLFQTTPLGPYNKRILFQVFLGNESLNTSALLLESINTRIAVTDRKAFWASMKRLGLQQSKGVREVNPVI